MHPPGRPLVLPTVILVLGLGGAACGPAPQPDGAPTVRVALHASPLSLDPHRRNEALTFSVLSNVYEALVAFDPHLNVRPCLASSWENPDALTWRFHLRRNVRFHDGRTLTADDVVSSFERARHQPGTDYSSYLVEVAEVRKLDDWTVEVVTARPYAIFLNKLVFVLVVPADAPAEISEPIGTGPYRLAALRPGEIELTAFEQYWGARPALERVDLEPVTDPDERLARLLDGRVDLVLELGAASVETVAASSCCRVATAEGLVVQYLQAHATRPPFSDRRVRRAIDLALDRTVLVDEMLHGQGVAASQMVGVHVLGYSSDLPTSERDLTEARRLLAESGYPDGFDTDLTFREGRDPSVIIRQLGEVGIRITPRTLPWNELYELLLRQEVDLYLGGFLAVSADASDFLDSSAHSGPDGAAGELGYGQSNFAAYSNPTLDALIETTGTALDMKGRRELLQQAMALVREDAVYIPLVVPHELYGVSRRLEWSPRLDGFLRLAEVELAPPG